MKTTRPANRLAAEKSPYLLQHAHNPVDWFPWGDEAFAKAAAEDKPVFLSIGYSTCHWCHVMERESFEDEGVARLMNEVFVCVKVDREERPDLDGVYMTVCQMMTGRGGWPLTVILTPDRRPFFAGTYFPKQTRGNHIGMIELAAKVQELWRGRRADIQQSANQIVEALRSMDKPAEAQGLGMDTLHAALEQLGQRFDADLGGFGDAPKFPTPHHLLFLLRMHRRSGAADSSPALDMAVRTLDAMRAGGLYDHLGFGFHRYSTDREWLLPHFEKMLYDQAQLVMAYAEAWRLTGKAAYKATAEEVMEYVLRDLGHPEGGFYSAEDADSEGVEGKFYVWTEGEVRELLGKEAPVFLAAYGFQEGGNFVDEATHKPTGANIPHLTRPLEELAREWQIPAEVLSKLLAEQRAKLLEARDGRVRPHLDDKILTDWNGLMIAAMAYAGRVFGEPRWVKAAELAASFVEARLVKDGRLLHRYRDGQAAIQATLNDYAFHLWGLIELYQATMDPVWLAKALDHQGVMDRHFRDAEHGGFFVTADDAEELLVRQKEFFDAALPAGNSVAMLVLLRLARLTGRADLEERAQEVNRVAAAQAGQYPSGFTQLLCAVDLAVGPSAEAVIVGRRTDPGTLALLEALSGVYAPHLAVLLREPVDERLPALAPFTKELALADGKPTAYVCRNFACQKPVTDAAELQRMIEARE